MRETATLLHGRRKEHALLAVRGAYSSASDTGPCCVFWDTKKYSSHALRTMARGKYAAALVKALLSSPPVSDQRRAKFVDRPAAVTVVTEFCFICS